MKTASPLENYDLLLSVVNIKVKHLLNLKNFLYDDLNINFVRNQFATLCETFANFQSTHYYFYYYLVFTEVSLTTIIFKNLAPVNSTKHKKKPVNSTKRIMKYIFKN